MKYNDGVLNCYTFNELVVEVRDWGIEIEWRHIGVGSYREYGF